MQATQITLQASPTIVENVLAFLNNFSNKDLQIIAKQEITSDDDVFLTQERKDISQMGGILANFVEKPITDEEIQEAITQGVLQRAYPK